MFLEVSTLVLDDLKWELVERKTQVAMLKDAHVDFEQDNEHLTAQREIITCRMAQAAALEAELERVQLAMEEQVNALTKYFL